MLRRLRVSAAEGVAGRRRALGLTLGIALACLAVAAVALLRHAERAVLHELESIAHATSARDASALLARHRALAAWAASAALEPVASPRAWRVERQAGADAAEFRALDPDTRLAVGGVLALDADQPEGRAAVDALLAALAPLRLAHEAEPDAEAIYVAVPGARAALRVPYASAEQLRLRERDARLAPWFAREFLDAPARLDEPTLVRDPVTGTPALRYDAESWVGARARPARVSVVVPVRAYLDRIATAAYPVRMVGALVSADGEVLAAAFRGPDASAAAELRLPDELAAAVATLGPRLATVADWQAVRIPIAGASFSLVVGSRTSTVREAAVARVAQPLVVLGVTALALLALALVLRRRVIDPAERAVRDLTAAEALMRDITDGVPGLAVFKLVRDDAGATAVAYVSRGAAAVLGVPAVAIADDWRHQFDPIADDSAAAVRANAERALAEALPWQEEFRITRRDEERWIRVEARATRTAAGVELVGSWRDVTETRVHTELLADAHRRLIELADGVPGAVIQWRVTEDGRQVVAFVGNRLPEIAGISTSDLYAGLHALEQVQLAEDLDAVRRARQQAVTARAGYAVEYRVMHPGRGLRWLREEAVSHPVAGCLAAFTVHVTDVTQQRREAGELRRAKEEAEQATRAKSVFLATMSHEIRTPMTGISGMIEVLSRTVLDADQRAQLATIADSARALRRILDDVLDFSRIEAGKMTVERRPISIDDVIEATAGLYAAAAEERGVRLRATVDPRIGELVMGDAVRLRQVLGNLLSNAVKFTARGTVRLAVTQESADEATRVLRFDVTDTGAGIPYDVQPRLFAPFERGEHETTTQVGGTGLGLALVKRIVDLMDGTVELRSLPGVGTAVAVRIPFERLHEETSDVRVWLTGLRVAVLQEDEVDGRFLAALLEGRGAHVTVVGPDAVTALPEGTAADVILTASEVPREAQHALRARVAPGDSGRTQVVRLFEGASLRPELRGDGGVVVAPHARRGTLLRAVAIAAGRDEPDLPTSGEPRTAASPASATVEEAIADRRLILVCEDHPIAQRVIEKQLRVLGYTAELHANGHSGLTAWRSGRYGLVLTDLHMPEMDGLTLARRIRAEEQRDPALGRTPIIALSGNAFDEQRVVCVEAGMDDFLAKPALLKELDATLRFWLPPSARPQGEQALPAASSALPVTLPAPLSHKALKEALGDDPDVLRQALGEFLAADADDFAVLYAAVEADDRQQVVSSAHRIEGAARMLGAMPYARAAERVKRLFGVDQDPAERVEAVHVLQQEGERLRTWLHTTRDWFERVTVGTAG